MSYKALYRTYRPQFFREVVGQDVVVKTLQNAVANKKISHAYLFSGPRGTGKTTIARIFAKVLNCENPVLLEPCNKCTSCHEISDGFNPDVIEIDAASNNGVDEIRDIRDKVRFLPAGAKYKIYIIDEVHMLSAGAFNALLKTLEEPPQHVVFILATTEPHKLPATIISRCQRFDFKSLSVVEISNKLRHVSADQDVEVSEEALNGISEAAEGGLRDALSILDQAISYADSKVTIEEVNLVTGNLNYDNVIELGFAFQKQDSNTALELIDSLINAGKEVSKLVNGILQFYRDLLLFKSVDTPVYSKYIFEKEKFKELAESIGIEHIFYYIDVLSDIQVKMKYSQSPRIYLEVAIIKMINTSTDDLNLIQRIKEIEEKIETIHIPEGFNGGEVNNEKVDLIELKVNRVVSELNRLNLQEVVDNVSRLKDANVVDYGNEVAAIIKELNDVKVSLNNIKTNDFHDNSKVIEILKDEVDALRQHINDKGTLINSNENINQDYLKDDLISLRKELAEIRVKSKEVNPNIKVDESKFEELYSEIELLNNRINELLELKQEGNETINPVINNDELELLKIEIHKLKNQEQSKNSEDINGDMTSRMALIEKQLYELVSKDLARKPLTIKKKKNDQVALFDDNLTPIKEFVVKKEDVDFEDLALEGQEDEVEEIIDEVDSEEFEETNEPVVVVKTPVAVVNSEEVTELKSKVTAVSELVVTSKEEKLFANERKLIDEEKKKIEIFQKDETIDEQEEELIDKFASYDSKVVETILHDSRKEECRNDAKRINQLWSHLVNTTKQEDRGTAEMLKAGRVAAVGNNELILVYSSAALCNQIMRPKFKNVALKIIQSALNDRYNYMALPEYLWEAKRYEYVSQYQMGVKFPKLTPIVDKDLVIIDSKKEFIDPKESVVDKTIDFFGKDIVNIE